MTKLIQVDDIWLITDGWGREVALDPQPDFSSLRWNGTQWEIYMGYPFGHGVPLFNEHGYWTGDKYDKWCRDNVGLE